LTDQEVAVTVRLTRNQVQKAYRMRRRGASVGDIARQLDCTTEQLQVTWARANNRPRAKPVVWRPREGQLSAAEREAILIGLGRHESMSSIARSLGRAPSTVTREVKANGGIARYGAMRGHARAERMAKRPKPCKLDRGLLRDQVTKWLLKCWSPDEIAQRLRLDFPDDPMMHVSHETIYQSLYVQGRGELRRELTRCLRSRRTDRKSQTRSKKVGHIQGMVNISARPAEVADRAVPGHWEGDLIIGASNRSAVGTLVERTTRFVLLLHLPDGRGPVHVERAMRTAIRTLPKELAKSVTWDQGKEMSNHHGFTVATGIPIYFCDPHSPWQRGTNENTNGLLRQFLPKGTDLSRHTPADLRRIQRLMNGRPRKTLGYMTPSEKLTELVALTG
jgi:IS30 family transposase